MALKEIIEYKQLIDKLRNDGHKRGNDTGFSCLDAIYSLKLGSYTTLLAEPQHGKSEFIMEMCMNQALKFGFVSLICSPETGTLPEVVAELIHKYTGKSMLVSDYGHLDDREYEDALLWINHHFIVPDDIRAYKISELFNLTYDWERRTKRTINIIVAEPYNELDHSDMVKFNGRQDLYIEDLYSQFRRECRNANKHFFLSLHPQSQQPVTEKGITYYPKPLPRQAAGGQAAFRKAMTWITLWRPPQGLADSAGWEYKPNEVHVFVDKAKPKGASFRGMCKIYFDWKKNRYYEEVQGSSAYAFEHENVSKMQEQQFKPVMAMPLGTSFSDDEEPPF